MSHFPSVPFCNHKQPFWFVPDWITYTRPSTLFQPMINNPPEHTVHRQQRLLSVFAPVLTALKLNRTWHMDTNTSFMNLKKNTHKNFKINTNTTLTFFFHWTYRKRHHVKICDKSYVVKKSVFDDVASTHFLLSTSFGKCCNNVAFPFCIMLESKQFFFAVIYCWLTHDVVRQMRISIHSSFASNLPSNTER